MTTTVETPGGQTLPALQAAVDSLLDADLARLSRDELLDALRGFEVASRQLAAVGHRLVGEVAARKVGGELRYRDTAAMLFATQRVTRSHATGRTTPAQDLEPLPPPPDHGLPAVL